MTRQEIFNTVCEHLITQNEQAMEDGNCLYRTTGGLKCAVGCLIKDEYYHSSFEDLTVAHVRLAATNSIVPTRVRRFINALAKSGVPVDESETVDLLDKLQIIHDSSYPSQWKRALLKLAEKLNLDTPECIQ